MTWIIGMIVLTIAFFAFVIFADGIEKAVGAFGCLVAAAIWTVAMSVQIVPGGSVYVASWFGSVQQTVIAEGLNFINPMTSTQGFDVRRDTVDFANEKKGNKENPVNGPAVTVLSSDRNPLIVEVSFPYSIQPNLAWKLFQKIAKTDAGVESKVLETHARRVTGEVFARHPWAEATIEHRDIIENELQDAFTASVVHDLSEQGFTEAEARSAFKISRPQLREVSPDPKVLNAIAERIASEELLKRQSILTKIAAQEAERRSNEGVGIARLFEHLPAGFKPEEIRMVLGAIADKERADAFTKAVELGRVSVIAVPTNSPIALPVQP